MKRWLYILCMLLPALLLVSCGTYNSIHHKPVTQGYNNTAPVVVKKDSIATTGNNFLLQNKYGLWEMYAEGDPLQLGLVTGALSQQLVIKQEKLFLDKVKEIVPSKFKQKLLRQFLKWYNRKLYLHVTEEYKTTIYGLSQYVSHDYDDVAPPYLRSLYLHAAHDIGHALNDLALVGCTSFAAWDKNTEDGSLLIARNLDFYAGDEFAQNKIVSFVKPDAGYPFMSVTWGGMIGALSGMNTKGITVTLNSGKSDMPLIAKTPISLLAREILQYAANIDEAVAIAKKREVFVSESIMVGSAADHKAVLIEVSPNKFGVYDAPNTTQLICSNHFQSDSYKDDNNNNDAIENSHSAYRYERMTQLLDENGKMDPVKAAAVMRNTEGLNNRALGYGNEKAINQLLAHHSVIFKPEQGLVWVSANPYQLGAYVAYDLNAIFGESHKNISASVAVDSLLIPEDPFVYSQQYKDYEQYRVEDRFVDTAINNDTSLPTGFIEKYQKLNPNFWLVYYKAGVYNYNRGYYTAARIEFEKALTREITTLPGKQKTEEYLKKINRKLN
ncbi:acyl-CoA--6-aminopenicillanic acid acyl-transferase [Flavobacterium sp. Sd200]|uniref:C45 family autoproteolytic acyltransferase/hydolase n=1 Tax=Flavobacterium sp. Sd200 TaxID=2692211 RepID=UPI00136DECD4|nr:C45 family peptidase [Flavobacterium sp. Sd200]MXN90022.1 acyl-CoA--6-aminopenicillanic acid acyl-transferase [Flavobacterium sp. Sd200]